MQGTRAILMAENVGFAVPNTNALWGYGWPFFTKVSSSVRVF